MLDSVLGQYRKVAAPASVIGGSVVAIMLNIQKIKQFLNRKPYVYRAVDQVGRALPTLSPVGVYNAPLVQVVGIPVSARKQEQYKLESEVTEHAVESGSIYTDHIILKPIQLDLTFEVTNYDGTEKAKASIEAFISLWEARIPMQVLTEHLLLDNMVCRSIRAVNIVPEWGRLVYDACFQQIKLVTLETVAISLAQVEGSPAEHSAVSPTDRGMVTPTTTPEEEFYN